MHVRHGGVFVLDVRICVPTSFQCLTAERWAVLGGCGSVGGGRPVQCDPPAMFARNLYTFLSVSCGHCGLIIVGFGQYFLILHEVFKFRLKDPPFSKVGFCCIF